MTGAMRRHKVLMAVLFVSIVAASIAVILSLPKSYHAEAKVLAHTNAALRVSGDGPGGEAPTHTAAETILRRDNLVSIIEQYDLVRHWQQHRATAERVRDTVMSWFSSRSSDTEQDRIDAMVEVLEKRLKVWADDNGATVSISIDWPDAQMASRIVDTAQQNYLESRHTQEITAIAESIAILTDYARASKGDVDAAVSSVNKVKGEPQPSATPAHSATSRLVLPPPPRPLPAGDGLDPRVTEVQVKIEAKKRTLNDLEDFRHRRLTDLQSRLADAQAVYTESHPAVVDLKQAIASISSESPQVKLLRSQIAALESERDGLSHRHLDPDPGAGAARSSPSFASEPLAVGSDVARLEADLREDRDPNVVYARGQLRDAMDKYSGLRAKIQAAQIDYDTAQAAFKYRYSVVTPAHVPKHPDKPKVAVDILAAIVGALFASVVLAVVADLRSGRLVEPWQLERLLDKPILGEVEVPRLPPHGAA
ncbi:MAG TPA: hypothetical protein VLM85_24345 [Polyangiaceae bacterium]|nr:hypothetical protein [Polyangiaceae bacterium]